MDIGKLGNQLMYHKHSKSVNKRNEVFSIRTEPAESTVLEDPIVYYKKLCKEFPDITFRLDDKETALMDTSKICLGYNGSMNQVGNNFSGIGQCSISIDIEVIRNMQKDSEYAQNVRGMIRLVERNYADVERDARQCGMMYASVNIEDEGGKLLRSCAFSTTPASTEEEVQRMWNMDDFQKHLNRKISDMQDNLLDNYMKMLEESQVKSQKILNTYYNH